MSINYIIKLNCIKSEKNSSHVENEYLYIYIYIFDEILMKLNGFFFIFIFIFLSKNFYQKLLSKIFLFGFCTVLRLARVITYHSSHFARGISSNDDAPANVFI